MVYPLGSANIFCDQENISGPDHDYWLGYLINQPYQNVEFFKKIFLGKNTAVRPISVYGDYVYQLRSKRKMSALTSSAWF